ncbi:MAG: PASTA domain-containing protein, partial [Gemmatimonadota bacterium]|nr:PASTA domain-containing protein [Gemmatimonadota bacterium]
ELIGLSQSEAAGALQNLNLVVGDVESVSHPEAPSGQVVWQDPPEGVVVEEGMQVQLSVSHGPQQVPIPDVANYDEAIARTLLEAAGLNVDITRIPTAAPRGVAVNTRPAIGTTRRPGDRVELLVSEGAPTIRVPDLKGMTVEEAGEILRTLGLSVGSFEVRGSRAQPPGTIFEQSPPAGTLAAPGTRVGGFTVRRP